MPQNTLLSTALLLAAVLTVGCAGLPVPTDDKKIVQYEQAIAAVRPINGVSISVVPAGDYIYRVQIKNSLTVPVKLLWDDSSFVTTGDQSMRIVRIHDRNKLPDNPRLQQAAAPVARGAQLSAEFTGESLLKLIRSGTPLKPANPSGKARIFLLFDIQGKDAVWQGEVVYTPKK